MNRSFTIVVLAVISLIAACSRGESTDEPFDPARFESEHLAWRLERLESLRGPDGYLNLAGLYWLAEGTTTIGSSADNDIVLPVSAAARVGDLQLSGDGVTLHVADGVDVYSAGQPITTSILVADDTTDAPITIAHGSIAWTIIRRDARFALRLRDFEHPAIGAFPPIKYYPLDPRLRVRARLQRFEMPKVLNVDTVIEGLGWRPESPGTVSFEIDGQSMQLEAYASGDELFFVFGDRTSGVETYPAGRFLYADLPVSGDDMILDFNRAYNPPCAFNDFATCPVASPQNRLAVRIEAGEKFDPTLHAVPQGVHQD